MVDHFQLRNMLKDIFTSAVEEIAPDRMIWEKLFLQDNTLTVMGESFPLEKIRQIRVVAAGKAAYRMCLGLENVLGENIHSGVVLSNAFFEGLPKKYEIWPCSHPLPTAENLKAADRLISYVAEADERDLVICLISGGGSSILSKPAEGISTAEKAAVADKLLLAGAPIQELNIVRKHLSALKGGKFLNAIAPAKSIALYLSDVPGDDLSTIASGPTVADPSSFRDAIDVLHRYNIIDEVPASVRDHLLEGEKGTRPETLKTGDHEVELCSNFLIGKNLDLLRSLEQQLSKKGFWTLVNADHFQGEARALGYDLAMKGKELARTLAKDKRPYAYIVGGETTVNVTGTGLGGRNTEVALAAAIALDGSRECMVLAAGTDGKDGPTDTAGAIADGTTLARALKLGVDSNEMLLNNDSYNFFNPLDDLVTTGPTGTNLMDIAVLVVS